MMNPGIYMDKAVKYVMYDTVSEDASLLRKNGCKQEFYNQLFISRTHS